MTHKRAPLDFSSCFKGRKALIVGGSSGIGFQVSSDLTILGAQVLLTGRDEKKLVTAREALPKAEVFAANLSSREDCMLLTKKIMAHSKTLDYLVISLGRFMLTPVKTTKDTDWDRMINENLSMVFWLVQQIIPLLSRGQGRSIMVLSSILAHYGASNVHAYCASKGGISTLVKSLAVDLAKHHIRINAVSPGHIETPMIANLIGSRQKRARIEAMYPLRRIGKPSDVSALVLFLLSPYASWITGCDYIIDGGRSAQA